MDSLEIIECLRNDEDFIGTFSSNTLPIKLVNQPCKLIVNLDESWKHGSHWIAIYISKNGYGFYFDSFGYKPPSNIYTFLERNCHDKIEINKKIIQGIDSINCGKFCIIFLYYCPDIEKFFRKIKPCEYLNNDLYVEKFFRKFFK